MCALIMNLCEQTKLGGAGVMTISSWFIVIGDFVYIFDGWCSETWNGFSFFAFSDLIPLYYSSQ